MAGLAMDAANKVGMTWARRRGALFLTLIAIYCATNLLISDPENGHVKEEQYHRELLQTLDENYLLDEIMAEKTRDEALSAEYDPTSMDSGREPLDVSPYNLIDAIKEFRAYSGAFSILVYDSQRDQFYGLYSNKERTNRSLLEHKLWGSMKEFAVMLRRQFPQRFCKGNEEFAVAFGASDYPFIHPSHLPHEGKAPVLQFGSSFRDPSIAPNVFVMPPPGRHLSGFCDWSRLGSLGHFFRPAPRGELWYREALGPGHEWDDLIPVIMWRGSDFNFLPTLRRPRELRPLESEGPIEEQIKKVIAKRPNLERKKQAAAFILRQHYAELTPRWKGVSVSADSEVNAKEGQLPWADIRFSHTTYGQSRVAAGSSEFKTFEEVDIAAGTFVSPKDMAKYKYHIDLAGGGGTTWHGTWTKLAMPGLLFHHMSPTLDYIHYRMKPWVHYVPIAPDLSDLEDKYIWAQNNPELAQRISLQAVELTKQVGSSDGFARMYHEDFVEPLRRIIDAYRPVSDIDPSKTWIDILKTQGQGLVPALRCQGFSNLDLCDHISFEDVEQDIPQENDGESSTPKQPQPSGDEEADIESSGESALENFASPYSGLYSPETGKSRRRMADREEKSKNVSALAAGLVAFASTFVVVAAVLEYLL